MDAAFQRRRPGWPLLATLGVHLLLALSWRSAHPPAPDSGGERVFELIPVPRPQPEMPRLRPQPPRPRLAAPAAPRARADTPPPDRPVEPEATTPPSEAPARVADPFAITIPAAPVESTLDALVGRARRDAGGIDRELRKGKSSVPEVADTPMGRLKQGLEAAYIDRSRTMTSESYTSPDGQIIYRFRMGGKTWCRTGGSVGPRIGGAEGGGATSFDVAGGGGNAGLIRCPSHGDWQRD